MAAALPGAATAAEALQDASHPKFPGEGFKVVFDGTDRSKLETQGNWVVKPDGILELVPRPGEHGWKRYGSYLWLPGEFADFVVDFEFQYGKGGNSGLYFRIGDTSDATASGFEIQILDSFGKGPKLGHHDMGGVIATNGPLGNASKPAGEWNRMTARLEGGRLTVVLNGKLVQDLDLADKKPPNKQLAKIAQA